MTNYEKNNMELLMSLKSNVEETGYLLKSDALLLIETCASLILQNEDTYRKNLTWQSDGKYIERVYQ